MHGWGSTAIRSVNVDLSLMRKKKNICEGRKYMQASTNICMHSYVLKKEIEIKTDITAI